MASQGRTAHVLRALVALSRTMKVQHVSGVLLDGLAMQAYAASVLPDQSPRLTGKRARRAV